LSGLDPEKPYPEKTYPEKTWDRPIAGAAIDVSLIAAPLTSAVMPRHRVSAFGEPDDRVLRGIRYSATFVGIVARVDHPAFAQVATANL
jgi:hypothetical protein